MTTSVRTELIPPGHALVHVIRAHRAGWDGTICASPEQLACGASEDFRAGECAVGRSSCSDLSAFKAPRPVLRITASALVDWLRDGKKSLEGQLLFLLSGSRRAEAAGELFVQGVYRVGTASVRDGDQVIVQPENDDWAVFPTFAVGVEHAPWRLGDKALGTISEDEARRWIEDAREAGRLPDPTRGWTESTRERLESFCYDRATAFEIARSNAQNGNLDGLPWTGMEEPRDPLEGDARTVLSLPSRKASPDLAHSRPDIAAFPTESPSAPLSPARSATTSPARDDAGHPPVNHDAPAGRERSPLAQTRGASEIKSAPAPWSVARSAVGTAIGLDRLGTRLRELASQAGCDETDLLRIDGFTRAGEIAWLLGDVAERALRVYAHAVSGGSVHELAIGPGTLDAEDLWRDPVSYAPTAFADAWSIAVDRPQVAVLANLRSIDAATMRPWLATLGNALQSDARPTNLLVVATSANLGSGTLAPASVERWLVPICPGETPDEVRRIKALTKIATTGREVKHLFADGPTELTGDVRDMRSKAEQGSWVGELLQRDDDRLDRVARATALFGARLDTTELHIAIAEALEWLDAVHGAQSLSGGLLSGYRRLNFTEETDT